MEKLNSLIESAIDRYITYAKINNGLLMNDIDEDLKNKIILATLSDTRFDRADILLDGNFNIESLLRQVNDNEITAHEFYQIILDGVESSISRTINQMIADKLEFTNDYLPPSAHMTDYQMDNYESGYL